MSSASTDANHLQKGFCVFWCWRVLSNFYILTATRKIVCLYCIWKSEGWMTIDVCWISKNWVAKSRKMLAKRSKTLIFLTKTEMIFYGENISEQNSAHKWSFCFLCRTKSGWNEETFAAALGMCSPGRSQISYYFIFTACFVLMLSSLQCEKKEEYIERIQTLDFETKAAIAAHIQEVPGFPALWCCCITMFAEYHSFSTELIHSCCFPADPQSGERVGSAVAGVGWNATRRDGDHFEEHGLAPPTASGPERRTSGGFSFSLFITL